MSEVSGPVVATTLVLLAVYLSRPPFCPVLRVNCIASLP